MDAIRLDVPCTGEGILALHAGDRVLLSGTVYTARDAAHRRMVELLGRGEEGAPYTTAARRRRPPGA